MVICVGKMLICLRKMIFLYPYFPVFGLNTGQKNCEYGDFLRSVSKVFKYFLLGFNTCLSLCNVNDPCRA